MTDTESVAIQLKAIRALAADVEEVCLKSERGVVFGSGNLIFEVKTLACAVALLANICERLAKDGAP